MKKQTIERVWSRSGEIDIQSMTRIRLVLSLVWKTGEAGEGRNDLKGKSWQSGL